ncbi:MAG: hypothetical protein JW864_01895 [Spirochaetes bacterium]|nr:hypothetical protein [Spirochaetota bacterium]
MNLKKITTILFCITIFSGNLFALNNKNQGNIRIKINTSEKQSEIKKMAVLPINTSFAPNYVSQGRDFASFLTNEFQEAGYNCIHEEVVCRIMIEQSLNQNNPVDFDTAVKIGKLSGADGVVMGELISSAYGEQQNFRIKFINVETGKIIWYIDATNVYKGQIAEKLKSGLE